MYEYVQLENNFRSVDPVDSSPISAFDQRHPRYSKVICSPGRFPVSRTVEALDRNSAGPSCSAPPNPACTAWNLDSQSRIDGLTDRDLVGMWFKMIGTQCMLNPLPTYHDLLSFIMILSSFIMICHDLSSSMTISHHLFM